MIPSNLKARGCLAGLCVGDALGSQFEFMHSLSIGLLDDRELSQMVGSQVFHTKPGQITDDSEMALCLSDSLIRNRGYNQNYTRQLYKNWAESGPIDMGITTRVSLFNGIMNPKSESNGALMRIAPLGIYGVNLSYNELLLYSAEDARITHDNKKVEDCNFMFTLAISLCIKENYSSQRIIEMVRGISRDYDVDVELLDLSAVLPDDYYSYMGHVEIAFRNAFYHLRNGSSFERAILDTIRKGGDTDTNAAICGALMGSYYGIGSIPVKWLNPVYSCDPDRPLKYHTKNISEKAEKLLTIVEG